jgi:uncharacterized protein (TIGR00159 family)
MRTFWDLWGAFSIADILDIAFVASLLYLLLLWFKRTKAVFVVTGIFIMAAIYVIARETGMILTAWIFQGFFAIFLIALVVIFQEELRSFFERLAVWSLGRHGSSPIQPKEVETLLRAVAFLTQERLGGLIVLKGRDPLERHVEGGFELDGKLSVPLLESIFDRHSEGHDGAVLIDGNRVTLFGTHLPLSKDFNKLSGMGTRHTAALGLAERVDAMCIAVSEERGTISVARDGNIVVLRDLLALEEHILSFLKETSPAETAERRRKFWKQHPWEKSVSLGLAVVLWLIFVHGFKPARQTFEIPIEARNLPPNLELRSVSPSKVRLTLSGLKRDFSLLDPMGLRVYVDLGTAQVGHARVMVSNDDLRIPTELRVSDLDPSYVSVQVAKTRGAP